MSISAASTSCIADPETAQLTLPALSQSAVFLDVDGTLLDLKPDPRDVVSHSAVRELLLKLGTASGGALALISGRAISDLDRIFAPLRLNAAGAHGGQLRLPSREWSLNPHLMHHARAPLHDFAAQNKGLLLEDKGVSLAMHYRQRPELKDEIESLMLQLCPRGEITLQRGKQVVELRPSLCDKGTAIANFMAEPPFKGRVPIFFGDDLTDEAGFAKVNELGGLSVRIGAAFPTVAQICITDVSTLFECLSLWTERLK